MLSVFTLPSLYRRIPLLLGSALLCLAAASGASDTLTPLPDMGDSSGSIISRGQERRLGQAFMRNIRHHMTVVSDPLLNSYIESLGGKLVSHSESGGQPFTFFLVEDHTINAFAGPYGYIGVNTGLILTTESESELAAVLAHEISHVTQRHLMRTFEMASDNNLATAALVIAAIVVGAATDNAGAGMAAAAGAQAGMAQRQINFTRQNEKEADRIGIQTLAAAEYDPRAMPVFFHRLGKANRVYANTEIPEFLRTHPITTNRIADARNRSESYPYRQYPDSAEYHLSRAILREQDFKNPNEAVTFFRSSLADGRYRNEEAQRYGYVRALLRARKYPQAKQELAKLQKKFPLRVHHLILESMVLQKSGQAGKGLRVLKDGLELYPDNYPLTIYYAEALMTARRAGEAKSLLEKLVRSRPTDAELYQLLARASAKAGQVNEGHQYMAEHYYLNGNLVAAVKQLDIALADKRVDYYRSAQMSARRNEFKQELADLKKQKP